MRRLRDFTGLASNALVVWLMYVAPMRSMFVASDLTAIVVKLTGRLDHPMMLMAHICADGHAINGVASQIRCRRPSKMNRNHPRTARSTCAVTDLCESHSTFICIDQVKIVMRGDIDVSGVEFIYFDAIGCSCD